MATQADVRRIALPLPETEETENHFAFSVPNKGKLKDFLLSLDPLIRRMFACFLTGAS